jgi:hypothetical protein
VTYTRALELLRVVAREAPTRELREAAGLLISRVFELEGSLDELRRRHHYLCPTYYLSDRICTCGARLANEVIEQALKERASAPAKEAAPSDEDWDLY